MQPVPPEVLTLPRDALDGLMPMHLFVSATGHIRHAGPTLSKVFPGSLKGRRFLEAFEVRRPRGLISAGDIPRRDGGRLQVSLRDGPRLPLKGQALATLDGGLIINLSFGISVVEAITLHGLNGADFAPTDLSIEMLYLSEAREAVMREAVKLNERLEAARHEAERLAMSDMLTGLANRRAMDETLASSLRNHEQFAVMHIDLDYFKDVNDTLGHAAGDRVLVQVAHILTAETRSQDCVARVGGDEFLVLLKGLTDLDMVTEIAWRIVRRLEEPIPFGNRTCRISASVGITTTDHYLSPQAETMLCDADHALYASKHAGRATVTHFRQVSSVAVEAMPKGRQRPNVG